MGRSHMSDADRNGAIAKFKSNGRDTRRLLVATNAIEEGIDVAKCNLIVRFSYVGTPTSWIQGAGRARYINSEIFVFENDPRKLEEAKSAMMKAAKGVGVTEKQIMEHNKETLENEISFSLGAAKISFWNCFVELLKYCQKVMRKSFNLESSLYKYHETKYGSKFIEGICFPTPNGVVWVSLQQVKNANVQWEKAKQSPRSKGWNASKFEKHQFSYVAMMEIHKRGLIDKYGELNLNPDSRRDAERLCADQFKQSGMSNDVLVDAVGDGKLMLASEEKSCHAWLPVDVTSWVKKRCPNGQLPSNVLGCLNEMQQQLRMKRGAIKYSFRRLEDTHTGMHLCTLHWCEHAWEGTASKKKEAQKKAARSLLTAILKH
eukprot:CAMPEP_0167783900 /NCGR_PEP_ID=MMETSP0111_2-20121227/7329_1 /TAXON_ID=91324 /ORGANISM="Lotharella globosa, Strain CCCM811" /LENGTH=373 /DNA_ID=CAMNT_0007674893 /DNA_START=85 /DNA_END=1206 /DNA_ORIENTATION=-